MTDIVVPTLGESVTEATVGKWLKKPGDAVRKDEPVVELETDKVSLEAPAPEAGVLAEIVAAEGETVGIGAVLGRLSSNGAAARANGGGAAQARPAAAPAPKAAPPPKAAPAPAPERKREPDQASAQGPLIDITLPDASESIAEVSIAAWFKTVGSTVRKDEALAEIESEKAALDVPSPADGVLAEILIQAGENTTPGAVIGRVRVGASAQAGAPAAPIPAATAEPAAAEPAGGRPTPSARRVMEENHIAPSAVEATGRGGRITKADALRALESKPAGIPATLEAKPPRALSPREERVKMTRLRQTIARRLKEAQNNAAMLTTFNDCDMTAIIEARKKYKEVFEQRHGIKLGFMGFFVKAVIQALRDIPAVNAEIDGDSIIYKNYYDVGVAVGTDRGLVVPVVRDADQKTVGEIEREIAELGRKARDGELSLEEMQGATFTISNGGVYGSLMSTPILNAPQSGILGMHRIEERPVAVKGQVVVRPMMYLALTYDHRIVDGREAVTFLVRVKECVEDPERLMLDL